MSVENLERTTKQVFSILFFLFLFFASVACEYIFEDAFYSPSLATEEIECKRDMFSAHQIDIFGAYVGALVRARAGF